MALVEEIASVLRERIYAQRYPAGARLPQEQLSAELKVSRTPLREALRVLEREGLVTVAAGQGARVVTGDVHTLLAAYQLRAVVDGLAARLAAENPAATTRTHYLRRIIDHQRGTVDPWQPRAYTASNVDFHEQVMHLAGNEFVLAQLPLLRMTAQVFSPVAVLAPDSARRAIGEHTGICDAIAAGSGADAERLAREHIDTTTRQLREKTPEE